MPYVILGNALKMRRETFKSFFCLFLLFLGVLLLDMLNYHGFGRHFQIQQRLWLYAQPVIHAALLSAVVFLSGRFAKPMVFCLLGWLVFFEVTDLSLRLLCGLHLSTDIVLILHGSSPEEVRTFLTEYAGWWFLPYVLVVVFGMWVLACFSKRLSAPKSQPILRIGMICLCVFTLSYVGKIRNCTSYVMYLPFLTRMVDNLRTIEDQVELSENPDPDLMFQPTRNYFPVGVVVIGESASRNHWGLYGYSRDTTPRLGGIKDDLFLFSDLVGAHDSTQPALRKLFTLATVESPRRGRLSLSCALSRAGCRSEYVSAQSKWGAGENMESLLFSCCARSVTLSRDSGKALFDDALLPYVDDFLARRDSDVLFLHLSGSHFPAHLDYPAAWRKYPEAFKDDVVSGLDEQSRTCVNHYDNSILFTDYILSQVIERLACLNRPAFLFYVSDHGESPRKGTMRVSSDMDLWELPMVVWLSREYRAKEPEIVHRLRDATHKPLQADQLFDGLLDLALVRDKNDSDWGAKSFLSETFIAKPMRMICNGSVKYVRSGDPKP